MKLNNILALILINSILSLFIADIASGQLVPDSSLNSTITPINNAEDRVTGGTVRGSNLFHSFQEFNVEQGRGVFFANPIEIDNILTRVTGNNSSNILGTLGVEGAANLFLINPNGIIFGKNASLNVNGSFLATTAEAVIFENQGLFKVKDNNSLPLLTINPSALLFNQINSGKIINRSTASAGVNALAEKVKGLRVPDGRSLLLSSSEINLDGGSVNAFGGTIGLAGTENSESLKLQYRGDQILFDIVHKELTGEILISQEAKVDVSEFGNLGSGLIQIVGKKAFITDDALINADTFRDRNSETAIDIRVAELTIKDGAQVSASIKEGGIGDGGNLLVSATNSIKLIGTSRNNNSGGGSGGGRRSGQGNNNSGNGDGGGNKPSKLSSDARGSGKSGNLIVNTSRLILQDGAKISASAVENSQGGDILINAQESITVTGVGISNQRQRPSGISTQVQRKGISGLLSIETKNLLVGEGAEIIADTFGDNPGGSIEIVGHESIIVTGVSSDGTLPSRIASQTGVERDFRDEGKLRGTGDGGNIRLFTQDLVVEQGGSISADTQGEGNAGNLDIFTNNLLVTNQGEVSVSAEGTGEAGSLNINVPNPNIPTSINFDNPQITLDNGILSAETRRGNQGNIIIGKAETLLLRNNSKITTNATESATGGNIEITSAIIAGLANSDITANAQQGQAGKVTINSSQGVIGIAIREQENPRTSDITATSELGVEFNGAVTFNTPDVDPTSGIVELPNVPIDATTIFAQDLCKFEDEKIAQGSSFIITGSGGLAPTSEEALGNIDRVVGWANRDDIEISNNGRVGVRQRGKSDNLANTYPVIQQSQGWIKTTDGSVWLVAKAPETIPHNLGIVHPSCKTKQAVKVK